MSKKQRGVMGFSGVDYSTAKVNLPPSVAQVDHNGNRLEQKAWQPRKGIAATGLASVSQDVVLLVQAIVSVGVNKLLTVESSATGNIYADDTPSPAWTA